MSSNKIIQLAEEIANARDIELPQKLVKIKDVLQGDDRPKKLKFEIYKYKLLDALSVAFKQEYGFIADGWKLACELVSTFCMCTTDFFTSDTNYQSVCVPIAIENILVLAKRLQDKHVKSKGMSDEYLALFRGVMSDYLKIVKNNSFVAIRSLKSQRLFQLLLNDEQSTSACIMDTYRGLINLKRHLLGQLDDKAVNLLLDEIVYKMATANLAETGSAVFKLLVDLCSLNASLAKLIVRRYKGIKMLTSRWQARGCDTELAEFVSVWESAYASRLTDDELDRQATLIQKRWRGYRTRTRLARLNKMVLRVQRAYRDKCERNESERVERRVRDDLKFELMLQHRRAQRERSVRTAALIDILPAEEIDEYMEHEQERSATLIQAHYRGYRARKKLVHVRAKLIEYKAAACIQRAVRQWLERLRRRREQRAFYSRPTFATATTDDNAAAGEWAARRELLLDGIRRHIDMMPPTPRTPNKTTELHDKAQRAFHNYVLGQRVMRQQEHNIRLLIATANNDAELLLNAPKPNVVTGDDVNMFGHSSKPIMLAAKEAHKKCMRKMKAKWWELLDTSSSGGEEDYVDGMSAGGGGAYYYYDEDELTGNAAAAADVMSMRRMVASVALENNTTNNNHNNEKRRTRRPRPNRAFAKSEKNQLKTKYLREAMTQMMIKTPEKSRIWQADLVPGGDVGGFSNTAN